MAFELSAPKASPDMMAAKELARILLLSETIKKEPNYRQWSAYIRAIKTHDPGITDEVIQKVLKWYGINCGDKYCPVVYSAKTFAGKFHNLMRSAGILTQIPITDAAKTIAGRLAILSTCNTHTANLPYMVQTGMNACKVVVDFLLPLAVAGNDTTEARIAGKLTKEFHGYANFHVEARISEILQRGEMQLRSHDYKIGVDDLMFSRLFAAISEDYTTSKQVGNTLFDRMVKALKR